MHGTWYTWYLVCMVYLVLGAYPDAIIPCWAFAQRCPGVGHPGVYGRVEWSAVAGHHGYGRVEAAPAPRVWAPPPVPGGGPGGEVCLPWTYPDWM